jgi:putative two-component system response regulator
MPTRVSSMSNTSARILVVDDEPLNRLLIAEVLGPLGYHLSEACDGEEALEAVEKQVPDLVLLDVFMPKLDGYQVCERLKQNPKTKLIPIIMLTSLDQLADRIRGVEAGADDFLSKPFHLAELIARVRSLVALKRYTDELENASAVLRGIAGVVENRDAYTGHHCKRVGDYGASVALIMGLNAEDVRVIRLAGLFHDLGKISVPDRILRKPGPLDTDEYKVMQTHPAAGATLVEPMKTMAKVIPLIRHHHERLDGSGYPDGLSGNQISLSIRIISVSDIYDALATRRPYKDPFPHDKCLHILREEAARGWWDPNVVEALSAVVQPTAASSHS